MKIIDISIELSNHTITYPGNPSVSIEVHNAMPDHSSHLSKISMGSHSGTHIDAPKHSIVGGGSISGYPLEAFYGECRVLDLTNCEKSIMKDDLIKFNIKKNERILAKTKNSERGFSEFRPDFIYLDGDASEYLSDIGIVLFGIDYLSVKQRGSIDNRPHTEFLKNNIPIVEGLDLLNVNEGEYILSCFPLKIEDIDGSPARAVLITKN